MTSAIGKIENFNKMKDLLLAPFLGTTFIRYNSQGIAYNYGRMIGPMSDSTRMFGVTFHRSEAEMKRVKIWAGPSLQAAVSLKLPRIRVHGIPRIRVAYVLKVISQSFYAGNQAHQIW